MMMMMMCVCMCVCSTVVMSSYSSHLVQCSSKTLFYVISLSVDLWYANTKCKAKSAHAEPSQLNLCFEFGHCIQVVHTGIRGLELSARYQNAMYQNALQSAIQPELLSRSHPFAPMFGSPKEWMTFLNTSHYLKIEP